jgi:hypothetical protein
MGSRPIKRLILIVGSEDFCKVSTTWPNNIIIRVTYTKAQPVAPGVGEILSKLAAALVENLS